MSHSTTFGWVHGKAVLDQDLDRVGDLVLVALCRARRAADGVEDGQVEQIDAAALQVGRDVARLLDDPRDGAAGVQDDCEVALDGGRIALGS